jgi:murein DD-endopeptidase MepM/ murein hydrolase activator NlpD
MKLGASQKVMGYSRGPRLGRSQCADQCDLTWIDDMGACGRPDKDQSSPACWHTANREIPRYQRTMISDQTIKSTVKRTTTLCAVAALAVGMSLPAAALPGAIQPAQSADAAQSLASTGGAEPQAFAAAESAAAVAITRDGFTVEIIKPEPVSSSINAAYSGQFAGFLAMWPASGGVNDGFGYRGEEFHNGIDIMAGNGASIVAASPGLVIESGYSGGWGEYVKIDHGGGIATLYAHMIEGSRAVAAGQNVAAGEYLGAVGDTGYATVSHLHFEVYAFGSRVDPMMLLP